MQVVFLRGKPVRADLLQDQSSVAMLRIESLFEIVGEIDQLRLCEPTVLQRK